MQQIALPRVLGLDGYGAWSTVNSIASVTYNPVIGASIQGVSRAVAEAQPGEAAAALRRTLGVHAVFAVVLATGFYFLSPLILASAGAPHLTLALQLLSGAMLLYALLLLIGAVTARSLLAPAVFDIVAATLRTTGLVVGAWLFVRHGQAGEQGARAGFVVCLVLGDMAGRCVGIGKRGPAGERSEYIAFPVRC